MGRSGHCRNATACLSLVSGFVESQEGPRFFIKPVSLETGEIRVRPPSHLEKKRSRRLSIPEHLAARRLLA